MENFFEKLVTEEILWTARFLRRAAAFAPIKLQDVREVVIDIARVEPLFEHGLLAGALELPRRLPRDLPGERPLLNWSAICRLLLLIYEKGHLGWHHLGLLRRLFYKFISSFTILFSILILDHLGRLLCELDGAS